MPPLMTYEPSGRFHPAALIGLPLLTAISSSVLAWFYVWAAWHCPVVVLRAFLPAVWGFLTGLIAALGVYWFNVRNPKAAVVLALSGALAGYAMSWVFWTDLALSVPEIAFYVRKMTSFHETQLTGEYFERITDIILDPGRIIAAAKITYGQGLWEVFRSGRNFTGPLLAAVWLGEAAIYFIFMAYKSRIQAALPFSETSLCWLVKQPLPGVAWLPEGSEAVIDRVKNGDVNDLKVAPIEKKAVKSSHLVVKLSISENSEDWSFISVTHMKIRKKGGLEPDVLIKNLAINSTLARTLNTRYSLDQT